MSQSHAYVAPMMDRYLGRLSAEAGAKGVTIMGSNGGALPVERARREPVHTVLSGPAGGVMGALTGGRRAGRAGGGAAEDSLRPVCCPNGAWFARPGGRC